MNIGLKLLLLLRQMGSNLAKIMTQLSYNFSDSTDLLQTQICLCDVLWWCVRQKLLKYFYDLSLSSQQQSPIPVIVFVADGVFKKTLRFDKCFVYLILSPIRGE